ncbi:2162_t:CDS:1, partial [Funneliformis caledonium]
NHDLTPTPKTTTRGQKKNTAANPKEPINVPDDNQLDVLALEASIKCKNITALKAIIKRKQNELT